MPLSSRAQGSTNSYLQQVSSQGKNTGQTRARTDGSARGGTGRQGSDGGAGGGGDAGGLGACTGGDDRLGSRDDDDGAAGGGGGVNDGGGRGATGYIPLVALGDGRGSLRNGGGRGAVGAVLSDHNGAVFLIGNGVGGDGAHGKGSQNSSEETHFDEYIEIDMVRLVDKERLGYKSTQISVKRMYSEIRPRI
ncbi:uncharacterized protein AFUA_2G07790 [Aspergillus fumigatus Af293]|uniref:Uncharacterized protein n=1 Tax=Aspergillus fumigatus (strain CBS 144.89 / FGSC A1163 / CEA10) TaxID=451804 RepID=B0XW75_ASPFC|nr:hypothetical protein AFUB_023830 [Aspergillus fumigatus A1163]